MESVFVTAIVFFAIYKIFELIIRRKERMLFIEKWNPSVNLDKEVKLPAFGIETALGKFTSFSKFTSLRAGCILLGVGFGLIVGILLSYYFLGGMNRPTTNFGRQQIGMAIVALVLFFGGMGMLISFLIETHMVRKQKDKNQ